MDWNNEWVVGIGTTVIAGLVLAGLRLRKGSGRIRSDATITKPSGGTNVATGAVHGNVYVGSTHTADEAAAARLRAERGRPADVEVLSGELRIDPLRNDWNALGSLRLFITPPDDRVTFPSHRASAWFRTPEGESVVLDGPTFSFGHTGGSLIEASNPQQINCNGPGETQLRFNARADAKLAASASEIAVGVQLRPAPDGPPVAFQTTLKRITKAESLFLWRK